MAKVNRGQLMAPVIRALTSLRGYGSNDQIYKKVIELGEFDQKTLADLHRPFRNKKMKITYELEGARTNLRKMGYIENSSPGYWSLTDRGKQSEKITALEIKHFIENIDKKRNKKAKNWNARPAISKGFSRDSKSKKKVNRDQLMVSMIEALNRLKGSGSNHEIYEQIVELEKFDEKTLTELHKSGKRTRINCELSWAKTYLRKRGYIESFNICSWSLTN